MPIVNRVADLHAEITTWRRDIHAHPELLYDVHRTAASVADKLKTFGCDEVVTGLGKTGVVGVIRGRKAGAKVVGLRADMDALPIEEATGVSYRSTVPGKMHACGHDGHTAMLLGAALLGWLEDDNRGACKIARVRQIFGGAEQHCGVAVVAASVHFARYRRSIGQTRRLLDRQRVHVCAQPDYLGAGLAAADDANHPRFAEAGDHFIAAERFEPVGNGRRRAVHVVKEFRVGVDVPSPSCDLGVQVGDAIDDRHRVLVPVLVRPKR